MQKLVFDYYFDDYVLIMNKQQKQHFFDVMKKLKGKKVWQVKKVVGNFLLENCLVAKYYELDEIIDKNMVKLFLSYKNKINLDSIKGEIKYKYGKNAKTIYLHWSNPQGQSMDKIAQELEHHGVFLNSYNAADLFFEFLDMYQNIRKPKQIKLQKLSHVMTQNQSESFFSHVGEKIGEIISSKNQTKSKAILREA